MQMMLSWAFHFNKTGFVLWCIFHHYTAITTNTITIAIAVIVAVTVAITIAIDCHCLMRRSPLSKECAIVTIHYYVRHCKKKNMQVIERSRTFYHSVPALNMIR